MSWTTPRARVAALSRSRAADDPDLISARQDLKTERLADYIKRTVDEAPPLTLEQRDRLALLLRGGVDEAPPLTLEQRDRLALLLRGGQVA